MDFDWDPAKDERTRKTRGFGFADVLTVFAEDHLLEWVDDRIDYGETRVVIVGMVGGGLVSVVYTDEDEVRRIISARVASRKERRLWHAKFR